MTERTAGGLSPWGLTILRIVSGLIFAAHGAQKAFEFGLGGTAGAFDSMGIPLPTLSAGVVIATELLGGTALMLGLLTRWVAVPLAVTMVVAMLVAHIPNGFFLPSGFEFTLAMLTSTVVILLSGPGALAVDNVLVRHEG